MSPSDKWINTPFLDCPRLAAHFTRAATKCGHTESLGIFKRHIASSVTLDTMHVLALVSLTNSQMSKTKSWVLPPPHFLQKSSCAGKSIAQGGLEANVALAIFV